MNRLQAIKNSNRPKDKSILLKNVLIKNTFDKLDTHHNGLPRNVICKVQESKYPKKMYILYIKGHYTRKNIVKITDYAGFFSDYKDAATQYVLKTLIVIFFILDI